MFGSDVYFKVIGITVAFLLLGLINSVNAVVFTEYSGYGSNDGINTYPGSSSGHEVQVTLNFEPENNANFSVAFSEMIAGQSQTYFMPPIDLAPISTLYLGYDFGTQMAENKKDFLYLFANPAEWAVGSRDDFVTFSNIVATRDYQSVYDPVNGSRIAEWSSSIPIDRDVPDPATLVFLGLGLVSIGVARWKKVSARKYVFRLMPQRELYILVSFPYARNSNLMPEKEVCA